MNLEKFALSTYTHKYLSKVPALAIGWGAFLTALAVYTNRRKKVRKRQAEKRLLIITEECYEEDLF